MIFHEGADEWVFVFQEQVLLEGEIKCEGVFHTGITEAKCIWDLLFVLRFEGKMKVREFNGGDAVEVVGFVLAGAGFEGHDRVVIVRESEGFHQAVGDAFRVNGMIALEDHLFFVGHRLCESFYDESVFGIHQMSRGNLEVRSQVYFTEHGIFQFVLFSSGEDQLLQKRCFLGSKANACMMIRLQKKAVELILLQVEATFPKEVQITVHGSVGRFQEFCQMLHRFRGFLLQIGDELQYA